MTRSHSVVRASIGVARKGTSVAKANDLHPIARAREYEANGSARSRRRSVWPTG
jgi:hypothetical protein